LQRINRRTPVEQMPHVWRMAWCQDYPDQQNWLYDAFHTNAPGSYSRVRPTHFEEVTAQAAATTDPAQPASLAPEAERELLADETPAAPVYSSAVTVAVQPWLTRQFQITGGQNFDEWRLDWNAKRKALGK
jgi:ABC-type oligopeptide transport system substrate-binding subunit